MRPRADGVARSRGLREGPHSGRLAAIRTGGTLSAYLATLPSWPCGLVSRVWVGTLEEDPERTLDGMAAEAAPPDRRAS